MRTPSRVLIGLSSATVSASLLLLAGCAAATETTSSSTPTRAAASPRPSSTATPVAQQVTELHLDEGWGEAAVWDGILYRGTAVTEQLGPIEILDPDIAATTASAGGHADATSSIPATPLASHESLIRQQATVTGSGADRAVVYLQQIQQHGSGLNSDQTTIRLTTFDASDGQQLAQHEVEGVDEISLQAEFSVDTQTLEQYIRGTSSGITLVRRADGYGWTALDSDGSVLWDNANEYPRRLAEVAGDVALFSYRTEPRGCYDYEAIDVRTGATLWHYTTAQMPTDDDGDLMCAGRGGGGYAALTDLGDFEISFWGGGIERDHAAVVDAESGSPLERSRIDPAMTVQFDPMSSLAFIYYAYENSPAAGVYDTAAGWAPVQEIQPDNSVANDIYGATVFDEILYFTRDGESTAVDARTGDEVSPAPAWRPLRLVGNDWILAIDAMGVSGDTQSRVLRRAG